MNSEDRNLVAQIGALEVDWPRTAGYYGGVGLALAIEMIEWPIAVFLAAIPLVKLLDRRGLPKQVRVVVEVFEGMSKPVGGDAEGTMQLRRTPRKLREVAQRLVEDEPHLGRGPKRAT